MENQEIECWLCAGAGEIYTDDAENTPVTVGCPECIKNENKPAIPEGFVLAPSELTAENGAKYLLLGEFAETTTVTCTACSYNLVEEGDCEVCGGQGEYNQDVAVSWTNIKAIYRKAIEELALPTEAAL